MIQDKIPHEMHINVPIIINKEIFLCGTASYCLKLNKVVIMIKHIEMAVLEQS